MAKQIPARENSISKKMILGGTRTGGGGSISETQALKNHIVREVTVGLPQLEPVMTVTIVNVALTGQLSSANGNGYAPANGERILVGGQTTAADNGPYIHLTGGAWARTTDKIQSGTTIPVARTSGGSFGGTEWRCYTTGTVTLGTTAQTWKQCGSILFYAFNSKVGLGTTANNASRLDIDGGADTGATLLVQNQSATESVVHIESSASSGTAIQITAGGGQAIEISGGAAAHISCARSNAGSVEGMVLLSQNNASDTTTNTLIEQAGTGYALDILGTGVSAVSMVRVRNTTAGSNSATFVVSNATNGGGYAISAALTSATSSSPAIYGQSDGVGEGGWFLNTLTGNSLVAKKSGNTGSAFYAETVSNTNTTDTAIVTGSGTGRGLYVYRNVSSATAAVVGVLQDHASSTANALDVTCDGSGAAGQFTAATNTSSAVVAINSGTGPCVDSQGYLRTVQIQAGGGEPTIANGGAIGAGGSTSITSGSADLAGSVTLNVGTGPGTSGVMATVSFAVTQPTTPRAIILTPMNATALAEVGRIYADATAATTTAFDINVGPVAHTASVTTEWHYLVIL